MNQEKIGKFISKLRKEKGLTQEQLAEKLNITKNAVSKWERGLGLMDISLLKPLSEILDVSITEVLNGEKIDDNIKDKSNEIVEKTLVYAKDEIKKNKIKSVFLVIFVILVLVCLVFCIYKGIMVSKHTINIPKNYLEVVDGLKVKNTLKIYKRTIDEDDYLVEGNIKIRNDFSLYSREGEIKDNEMYSFVRYSNKKDKQYITLGKMPQYIDLFVRDDITFFYGEDDKNISEDRFTAADRKYFLLRNDINNDIDFLEYIKNNYFKKNTIFMSDREIRENYAFNLFVSVVIPEENSISLIKGDYEGFIFNLGKSREIHIIRDDVVYSFLVSGDELITDEYIIDWIGTLEII